MIRFFWVFSNFVLITISLTLTECQQLNNTFSHKSEVTFSTEEVLDELFGLSMSMIQEVVLDDISRECANSTVKLILEYLNTTTSRNTSQPWIFPLVMDYSRNKQLQGITNYNNCLNGRGEFRYSNERKYCLFINYEEADTRNGSTGVQKIEPSDTLDVLVSSQPLLFGSCISTACSTDDTKMLVKRIVKRLGFSKPDVRVLGCHTNDSIQQGPWNIFMMSILGVLVIVCIAAIFVDDGMLKSTTRRQSFGRRILTSFSIKQNLNNWLRNDTEQSKLTSTNGILFLTVVWIILGHSWQTSFESFFLWKEIHDSTPYLKYTDWGKLLIKNSHVVIDTLFTVSGLTAAYRLLVEFDKMKEKAIPYFYLHTILRLIPVYIFVVGIMATLYTSMADGPMSTFVYHASQNCKMNGWKNIIYINNFGISSMQQMCLPDSWYFAIEMQFLILLPILIYILWKLPKFGLPVLGLLLLGSIVGPAILMYQKKMLPALISTRDHEAYFSEFYIKPWNRSSPFLVGIFCAYCLRCTKKNFKLSKGFIFAGWFLSTVVVISVIFTLIPYFDVNRTISTMEASIYSGLHRFIWGMVIAWIIFASSRGFGGWIGNFLSWKFFEPLGNVSFTAFLIVLPIQYINQFQFRQTITSNTYTKVSFLIADVILTYFVAILLTLLLGFPSIQLGNILNPNVNEDEEECIGMNPKKERYGIYYDKTVSVCMQNTKGFKWRRDNETCEKYSHRQRYGIFYNKDISISINSN